MRILTVVCPNGLGHYHRTINILSRLRERLPDIGLDIVCQRWQVKSTMNWGRSKTFWQGDTRLFDGIMEPGVTWAPMETYGDGRLMTWLNRLTPLSALSEAQLVISDNLAAVLETRPDTILQGSFLWSDIFDAAYTNSDTVDKFIVNERRLLKQYTPPMICVSDVAMPGIFEQTDFVGMGWMCEDVHTELHIQPSVKIKIALLGGATTAALPLLKDILAVILEKTDWQIALPSSLNLTSSVDSSYLDRIIPFHFTLEEYRNCHLTICRPGMGTVTDCVSQLVPIIALHEPNNVEMIHIGHQIEKLGIGRYLGVSPDPNCVLETANEMLIPKKQISCQHNMLSLDRNGLEQAANWYVDCLLS